MNRALAATLSIVGLALTSSPAFARQFTVSGNGCQPSAASLGCAEPGQWGMGNTCAGAVTVFCALPLSKGGSVTANVTSVTWDAFDRSSSDDVVCTLHRTDGSGVDLMTPISSRTSGNKAASQPAAFLNIPANQSVISTWWISCSIPGTTSSGFSHLVDFIVGTSE
jgi:hypothetical protein